MLLALLAAINIECDVYRFDEGIAEFWFQVPTSKLIIDADTAGIVAGTINLRFQYELKIRNVLEGDSVLITGNKEIPFLLPLPPDEQYCIEYIPFDLYPGDFEIKFKIFNNLDSGYCQKHVEINELTNQVNFCDLIIGKKSGADFKYRGINFYPTARHFSLLDTLFSYIEIYGLRPDSLFYTATYSLLDTNGKLIFSTKFKRRKMDYCQIETLSIYLGSLVEGNYQIRLNIEEPVTGVEFEQQRTFTIVSRINDAIGKKFYRDINYIVSDREYKKFMKLSTQEQELFLKNFWKRNDYWSFEERITTADELFSLHGLKGRDSHRGRYLIDYGEPEEREIIAMLQWGRQLELWHYYASGKDALFCDTKQDGNPRFIAELDIGELNNIFEKGIRDADDLKNYPWLKEIAPGTYEQKTTDDIDQQHRLIEPDDP